MIISTIIILSLKYHCSAMISSRTKTKQTKKNNLINYKREFTYISGQKIKTTLKDVHMNFL